ncbi:DUF4382 domain-containing protein [Vibrio hannami]|uniref:DUF4382 domain-containing protein n=1 Tax=Vibrio hannami TaxID=2717094 RepID=UPI00240ED787|nr:DUF4382 domain-containing protein [Vibrio hannami]MDG3085497.1 DUF4382 domain-containing protein [Vibrio hannami]
MKLKWLALGTFLMTLLGCNSSDGSDNTALVSFSVSDAPVEDTTEVVVAFDALELIHENGHRYFLNVVDTNEHSDYQQIDLLEHQGSNSKLILSDERIAKGHYKNLIIHIKPNADLNWVMANGQHDLKVPSNKLQLGSFEVTEETVQSFTIEFDLRQSLVLRGNNTNNSGYNLKPQGVKIVDNGSATSIWGNVEPALFSEGEACSDDGGNVVYLYQGHDHNAAALVDNIDTLDDDYLNNSELPEGFVVPYASVSVMENGDYYFGFIPSGNYTIAFTCSAYVDDPIQYDQIKIANPNEQSAEITTLPIQEYQHNFY